MVMARLHIICGNCGCNNMFTYEVKEDVYISCANCSTLHNLEDTVKKKKKQKIMCENPRCTCKHCWSNYDIQKG